MRRYPEYKDSDVEWIGKIPKEWSAVPLTKYLESIIDYRGRTPEKTESGRFLVTAKNIRNGKLDYRISQEFTSELEYQRIMTRGVPQIGDVLFTTEAPLGQVANVDDDSIALAQRVIKFRPKFEFLNPYFLKYWILSHSFQTDLQQYATGSTVLGIKASKLCLLKLNLPPLKDQAQIANFLDHKTAQIDELIRAKERKIELLGEYRASLINQAVTKGLDPNVEMKPSGVESIGEIPRHWDIRRLKYVSDISVSYGLNIESDRYTTEGIRFVRITDIDERGGLQQNGVCLSESSVPQDQLLNRYDLLFSRSGSTVGKSYLHLQKGKFASAGYLVRFNFGNYFASKFIYYITLSQFYRDWLEQQVIVATIKNVNGTKYSNFEIPFPLHQEQKQIVNFLDLKTSQLDELRSNEEGTIKLLKEYRQSLISEAVTGKIDVRGEV